MVALCVDSFPGSPPSDVVLTKLRRRCELMPDVAALGSELLDRLEGLLDDVAELEEAAPERRTFIDCLARLAKLTARKPLLVRLAASDALAEMIQQLHTEVDEVAGRVNQSASDALTWRETWADARVEQVTSLKQQIERATDRQLMKELRSEQLGEMVYMQLKRNMADASLDEEMLQLVSATTERISSLVSLDGVPVPDWFMLADSLVVEENPHEVRTFGSVQRATWYHDGQIDSVMVKTLVPELAIPARDLLAKELQQWFSLPPHPSISKLYGGCHMGSELWYASELAANGNVLDFFQDKEQRYESFCHVFVSVAQGLQFLHEHGIVHGALTCSNILVTKDSGILLSDFGFQSVRTLAATLNDEASKAASSSMRWKAKEALSGEELDEPRFASDVYALGICMVEFLTREIPFTDMTDEEVMDMILRGKGQHNDVMLPEGLWDLITNFCDPNYTKRPRIDQVITQISQFTINGIVMESMTITVEAPVTVETTESCYVEEVASCTYADTGIDSAETPQTTSADGGSTETMSDYSVLLLMQSSPLEHVEAEMLRKATKGLRTTKQWIYPVVMARTNAEIALLKNTFEDKYGVDLVNVLKGKLHGDLKKVVLTAMRGEVAEFDVSVHTSAKAAADAEALYKAGEGRLGTDETTFINILALSPAEHVRCINSAYLAKYNTDIKAAIKNEFSGTAKLALLFLVRSILEPINVLAELFETTLKSAGKNTFGLRASKHAYELSALVVRYYRLLVQIRRVYLRKYRQELRTRIQSVVSGEYCQLLLSIFDTAEAEFGSASSASGGAAVSGSRATSRASAAAMSASASVEEKTSASIDALESVSVPDARGGFWGFFGRQNAAGMSDPQFAAYEPAGIALPRHRKSGAGGFWGHFSRAEEDEDVSTTDVTFETTEEVPATTTEETTEGVETTEVTEATEVTFETTETTESTEVVEETVEETEVTEGKKPDSKKRRKPTRKPSAGTTKNETTEVTEVTIETVESAEEVLTTTVETTAEVTVTETASKLEGTMEVAATGHGPPCPICTLTLWVGEQWCRFCGASSTVKDDDACRQSFAKYTKTHTRTEVWQRIYELSIALRELHDQGVIHGDLKPANIRIGRDGKAHLSGFMFSRRSTEPQVNPVVRTDSLRWKAPEHLAGGDTSVESDVYSLGMCIIHAVSGQPPWGAALSDDEVKHLVEQHKMSPRPDSFTDAEWELIESMCCHDPTKRVRLEEIVTTLGRLKSAAPELRIDRSTISFSDKCFSATPLVSRYQGQWKDADVAVEQVKDDFKSSNRSFLEVAELWLSLKYPTLLQLYGSCEDGSHQLFVCEFAEQGDLKTFIQQHPVDATEPLIWQIMLDAALGVQYLHTTNIVHGGITLDNILVTADGKGKLSGFLRSVNLNEVDDVEPEDESMDEPEITFLSDVSSLGRCFREVFSDEPQRSDRSTACAAPATQPDAVCDEAWHLIMDMCSEPCPRIDIVGVVQRLARLAAATKAVQSKLREQKKKLSIAQLKTVHILVIEEMIEIEKEEQLELEAKEEDDWDDNIVGLGPATDRKEVSKRQTTEEHADDAVKAVFKDLDAKLRVPFTPKRDQTGPRKLKFSVPRLFKTDLFAWMIIPESVQERFRNSHLGDGVSAKVFSGAWLGTPVALKTMVENTSSNRKDLMTVSTDDLLQDQALHEEANIWFGIRHPNVVSLFGVCTEGYQVFVCDLVDGYNLDTISRGKVEQVELWRYLHDAAIGLQGLHLHGIVHADLKCDNILVDKNGRAKLIDFGLSCLRTCDGGKPRGAYRWKAPECLEGAGPTVESDVFSFGICIYQAISGRYPWEQVTSDVAVRRLIVRGELPAKPDGCTPAQWGLITRMCRFDPRNRLQLDVVVQALGSFAKRKPYTSDLSLQHTLAEWEREDENA